MKARLFATRTGSGGRSAAVAFGLFMIMLDNTVVNVALPSIQELARTCRSRELEWVVDRLRAHVRRAHAHRRQARRPASGGG